MISRILLIAMLIVTGNLFAVDVSRGSMLSNSCFACHGTAGKSQGAIPSINGKSAIHLKNALKNFKTGTSTMMGRHAKAYSDEDIEAIADYISKLKK